jgi:hypothetical protein
MYAKFCANRETEASIHAAGPEPAGLDKLGRAAIAERFSRRLNIKVSVSRPKLALRHWSQFIETY